jgi:hypothetical protein
MGRENLDLVTLRPNPRPRSRSALRRRLPGLPGTLLVSGPEPGRPRRS